MSILNLSPTPQGRRVVIKTSKVIDCTVAAVVLHLLGLDAEVVRLLASML